MIIGKLLLDIKKRLNRLYEVLEKGDLTQDDLGPRIQEHRSREKALNVTKWEVEAQLSTRKIQLADKEPVKKALEDLNNLLYESPLCETRTFIKSFVKEVRVTGEKVIVVYTIPTAKGLFEEKVLPTVKDGGRYRTRTYDPLRVKQVL